MRANLLIMSLVLTLGMSGIGCDNNEQDVNPQSEHGKAEDLSICNPMDAKGTGLCELFFGYAWNGNECVGLSGCSCVGNDCGNLPFSKDDCETKFKNNCQSTNPENQCQPMDAKGTGLCELFFGYAWNGNECVGLSGCSCVGNDCGNLPFSKDDCETKFKNNCQSTNPENQCQPMDAKGTGLCELFFGYAWNGNECVGLSGCSCVGNDCGNLPFSKDDCETKFNAQCPQ